MSGIQGWGISDIGIANIIGDIGIGARCFNRQWLAEIGANDAKSNEQNDIDWRQWKFRPVQYVHLKMS